MPSASVRPMDFAGRTVVGLTEEVELLNGKGVKKTLKAKIDTGADRSSIDRKLCDGLGLGPYTGYKIISQVSGKNRRPYIRATIRICGRRIEAYFSIADRTHMKHKVLIGKNILKRDFLIDPTRK